MFDFCERVDPSSCNRSTIETLIKAGAFDALGAKRSQWMAVLDRAIQSGSSALADRKSGQKSLFDALDEDDAQQAPVSLPDMPEWEEREKLLMEKEVLGYYLSSHPLEEHRQTLQTYCSHTTQDLAGLPDRMEVILGGMLSAIKPAHVRNPRPGNPTKYANFDLEDMAGTIRCILWPEQYAEFGELVVPDAILVARGSLDRRGGGDEANLIVDELIPLDKLDSRYTRGVLVRIDEDTHGDGSLEKLREILRGYPGSCDFHLLLRLSDGTSVSLKSEQMKVEVNPEMRSRLDDLLGPGHVKLLTATRGGRNGNGRGNGRNGGTRKARKHA